MNIRFKPKLPNIPGLFTTNKILRYSPDFLTTVKLSNKKKYTGKKGPLLAFGGSFVWHLLFKKNGDLSLNLYPHLLHLPKLVLINQQLYNMMLY